MCARACACVVAQVREKDLSVVIHTLAEEFNIFREVDGESVPVHSQEVNNSLQGNGREGETELTQPSTFIHMTQICTTEYCVCVCSFSPTFYIAPSIDPNEPVLCDEFGS